MTETSSTPNVEDLLSELTRLLADLEKTPDNVQLLRRQIRLMEQLGMTAEVLDAYGRLSSLVMLSDESWLAYINTSIANAQQLGLESFVEILEKFDQAEKDYLSLAVLTRHVEFITSSYQAAKDASAAVSEEVVEFLTQDTARSMLRGVAQRAQGLLNESQAVWQPWLDWELQQLEGAADRQSALENIHTIFLERMATPHLDIETTSSAYSTFCSEHCPQEYEQRLVQATQAAQGAKTKLSLEKRYGKTREDFEQQIAYSSDPASSAQILTSYSAWESDQRLKPGGTGKAPTADHGLTRAVFERTVAQYANIASSSETTLVDLNASIQQAKKDSKGKGKQKSREDVAELDTLMDQRRAVEEAIRAYKDAEASIWAKYASWADDAVDAAEASDIRLRAVRACPHTGDAWCRLLLDMERNGAEPTDLTTTFERSLSLGLLEFPIGRSIDLVEVFLSRAAYESRVEPHESGASVMATIVRGLEMVSKANKPGDTTFKLEKFMLEWCETKAPELLDQALMLLDKPSKARSSAYQMVLLRTAVYTRRGALDDARELFIKSIQRHDLDWPEAIYEAFIQFENVHGGLDTLFEARQHIEKEQEKVTKRREKAALEAQSYQQYTAPAPVEETAEPMVVDASEPVPQPASAPEEDDSRLKRDREHTTVLVSGLPKDTTADRIEAFFLECGRVRETIVLSDDNVTTDSALVEFKLAEAIPLVLAKDHRKLDGNEISISMLWRSTLFVTNFPREMDDEAIRRLFGQYGRILQTRWPSRKYSDTRRFCYITMESPSVAQEATVLNGYKTDGGFGLTVLISDPSVKAKRSDATNSTLFIGGLNAKTTEADVRSLFHEHGSIRSLKLGWNAAKRECRGFAFLEMATEAEAKACLSLQGKQFQGRYLKVTMSDPNFANKKDPKRNPDDAAEKRSRSVRLSNLPDNAQEGLLQQALEKFVPVKRLEMFARSHEAVAELESQADAGKLLLRTEPFLFEGQEITIAEQARRPPPPPPTPAAGAAPESSTMFAPRAARKGKVIAKPRPTAAVAASKPNQTQAGQDDFRALVAAKNKQREDNLAGARGDASGEKRKSENEEQEQDAKRPRQ
nr:uncharacterized protein CI109_000333 [Kwoniella shandongensis]KAA5531491.1 hypothetical protein CI109_000333 [Kwoniella shandongensis]